MDLIPHRSRTRAAVISVGTVIIAVTFLATACGSSSSAGSSGAPPRSAASLQDLYKAALINDRTSLDRGALAYTPISGLKTAKTSRFKVVVIDTGRGPETAVFSEFGGMSVAHDDVPTGGIVAVQIAACFNLTCDSMSSPKQPVLQQGMQATWLWQITAGTPGPAQITLRVDTYDQGSGQTLAEEFVFVNGRVAATAAFNQQQSHKKIVAVTKTGVNAVATIGSVAGAIVAVGAIIGWFVNRARKRKRASSVGKNNDAPSGGGETTALGQSGHAAEAARQFRRLLEDQVRELGPDNPTTLATRGKLAHWLGKSGQAAEAAAQYRRLLEDQVRVLGPDDPTTLVTRNNLAHYEQVLDQGHIT